MWPHKTTPLRGDTNLWVGAPCGLSLANKFGSHGDCDGQEEKCIMGNMDLIDSYYHWKKLRNTPWEKKLEICKKLFSPFMTLFHNTALKIETIWPQRVVKPILDTRTANVSMYF